MYIIYYKKIETVWEIKNMSKLSENKISQEETLKWLSDNNMSIESLMPQKLIQSIKLANKKSEERRNEKKSTYEF